MLLANFCLNMVCILSLLRISYFRFIIISVILRFTIGLTCDEQWHGSVILNLVSLLFLTTNLYVNLCAALLLP